VRTIQEYFDLISGVAEQSGAESTEIEFDQDQAAGTVDGVLYFYDGSRLEFTETVSIQHYRPVKLAYRYQYIRAGEAIFRYDNVRHHRDLSTFPHHKHVGKERLPATEPTLSQVLKEVAARLGKEITVAQPAPKRRRRSKR
jgi:hypothetical protein